MNAIASLIALSLLAAAPGQDAVRAFALAGARAHVAPRLKAPAGADYGVYRLQPLGKTSIYPGNRYRVEGYVDAPNVIGTKLRCEWAAVVRITEADRLALLGVTLTDPDGDEELVYEAPAVDWCRPDVLAEIREEYTRKVESVSATMRRLPKRSRDAHLRREVLQYLAKVRRERGLTAAQVNKILDK